MVCGAFAAHHKVDYARLSVSENGPTEGRREYGKTAGIFKSIPCKAN
ncbi:hypothetical protein DJ86_5368 [Bacillus cereus ATCC 4342]|nr:hypothetical protein BF35_5443 [Bacillus cereus ATCC 4342]KFM89810.1 hypothetical protein DJ86_5368 [Bacillus cereus ATCC 4342]